MENKDIRVQDFFEKSETEIIQFLLKHWEMEQQAENNTIRLIGTYKKEEKPDKNGKEYGFFTNVRNLNGDILYYPFRLGQVRIFSMHKEQYTTDFFQIDVDLAKEQVRKNSKNPFVLNLNKAIDKTSNKIIDRLENERFIKNIFNETGFTQRDAKGLSNALKRIAGDLYTETERFIFELLQNADDLPNENNEVEVKFKLLKENLLFLHTGKQFTKDDVESISSIGDSTKRKDSEKTGYKGIGFKSVFSDANTVLINSGNFSFSFDKESPLYKEVNIDETPWEIKPIWTERYRYPKEVRNCEDFFKYSVAIDLEVNELKVNNYKKQIDSLFKEPRFLLFLRNVKTISVDGLNKVIDIKKIGENNKFTISNNDLILSEWIIDDFDFNISQEVKELMENDKIVPEKLKFINKSKLSFASQIIKTQISKVHESESYLFTYLPTSVNDYKFPFLINADFLTTANRQSIHSKNVWNLYIFEQISYFSFKWIASLAQSNDYILSCLNLIPNRFNVTEPIHEAFNIGFDKAINEIAFIPNINGDLSKVKDTIVDFTGLSELLGADIFIKIVCPNLNLVINELENKKALKNIGAQCFEYQDLINLLSNSDFQKWLKVPENNFNFIKFLSNSKQDKIKHILVENSVILNTFETFSLVQNTYEQLPKEIDFLLLETIHPLVLEKLNNDGIILNFKIFNPNNILNENKVSIIENKDLLNFWCFVYDHWENINSENSNIEILTQCSIWATKVDSTNDYSQVLISTAYFNDELIDILKSLDLNDFFFISNDYINENRTQETWFKIFKKCGAKSDLQNLISEIIDKLEQIEINKHIEITKQLFKYWKDKNENLTQIQLNKIKKYLKLICIDGISRISNECIIGDYYTDLASINNLLPEIDLGYQLNPDYGKGLEWKHFFNEFLGIKILIEKQDILDQKLHLFTDADNLDIDSHFTVITAISKLYENKTAGNLNFDKIKNIQMLNNKNVFIEANKLHFCDLYNPKLKLEREEGITILNEKYHPFIKSGFLKFCGVIDNFKIFINDSEINFTKIINLKYKDYILNKSGFEKKFTTLKSLFNENQIFNYTSLSNNVEIRYLKLSQNINFSERFWEYLKTEDYSKFSKSELKNNKHKYQIFSEPIIYLQTNKTIINLNSELAEPQKLYSKKLQKYISDKSQVVGIDFTGNEDLEEAVGISQKLSQQHCIDFLKKQAITLAEIEDLKIVDILIDFKFSNDDLSEIQILNKNGDLKKPDQLYISENNEIEQESILHPIFEQIAINLGVKTVSENELVLNFEGDNLITAKSITFKNSIHRGILSDPQVSKNGKTFFTMNIFDKWVKNPLTNKLLHGGKKKTVKLYEGARGYIDAFNAFQSNKEIFTLFGCLMNFPLQEDKGVISYYRLILEEDDSDLQEIFNEEQEYWREEGKLIETNSENNSKNKPQINEIQDFFNSKGKFIAYQINQDNYLEISDEIIKEIKTFQFYETSKLWKSLPNTNYHRDLEYAIEENDIYYTNNWKTNNYILYFLFEKTGLDFKLKNWFKNLTQWEDKKIIQNLEDTFGETPFSIAEKEIEDLKSESFVSNNTTVPISNSKSFEDEVNSFIENELENTEWQNHIPELKNLLELGVENPKEKQKAFNLIAKLKLSQSTNIQFKTSNKGYNKLEDGNIKYFVHSARGAFAYIHPNEIIKMKDEGYKMALDFGKSIVIYNTVEDILSKNKSHLMVYQNQDNIDNVIQFCIDNADANKHLLFIDPENSKQKSNDLMKLIIQSDDY